MNAIKWKYPDLQDIEFSKVKSDKVSFNWYKPR